MKRDKRFVMRITNETQKLLKAAASERGVNVSQMLREVMKNTVLIGGRELNSEQVKEIIDYYRDCLEKWCEVAIERQATAIEKMKEVEKLSTSL